MDLFEEVLSRNVEAVYPNKKLFLEKLKGEKKLRIYLGIDPSSPKIHLGNAVGLRKLAQFQKLGHQIVLLIGDFTGMIGDPTGRDQTRVPLTKDQVLQNAKTYQKQASKILNFSGKNRAQIEFNSKWLAKLNFSDLVKLSSNFTVQQMLERDMFQKRLSDKKPIGLHEFLYPIMQGYDSVALDVDVEMGGSDQTFNMLVGRSLQEKLNNKQKFVLTWPLLLGTDGRKMSKSYNNSIDISTDPNDMFAQVMSVKDELILNYFELCTDTSVTKLSQIKKDLKQKNPLLLKKDLALAITSFYHSPDLAKKAQNEFEKVVQNKELPSDIVEKEFSKKKLPETYLNLLKLTELVPSASQANRLAQQGAIEFNHEKISDLRANFDTDEKSVLIRAGKRNYLVLKFV